MDVTGARLLQIAVMIAGGFPMDRSYDDMKETWKTLRKNQRGEVFKKTGDFSTRGGLCHEPISERALFNYTVCHKVKIHFSSV